MEETAQLNVSATIKTQCHVTQFPGNAVVSLDGRAILVRKVD